MYQEQLAHITNTIIHAGNTAEEHAAARDLSHLFFKLAGHEPDQSNEKRVQGGIALSSYDAAICVDDYLRTTRFIKGVYMALNELVSRFPGQRINVLYAGCGPFGTILLPVLPLFEEGSIHATLIDMNESSLASVKGLVSKLSLENYISDMKYADATQYKYPASLPLHLVVSETMFNALTREPQVAITANLAPQIVENGILVPQEIRLDLGCTFFAKEPYFQTHAGAENTVKNAGVIPERVWLDPLFSMNIQQNFSELLSSLRFESKRYKVPADTTSSPDLCIFTSLVIFKDIVLGSATSAITNPHPLSAISNLAGHSHFRLVYDFKEVPTWNLEWDKE